MTFRALFKWLRFSVLVSIIPLAVHTFFLMLQKEFTIQDTFLYKPDFLLFLSIFLLNAMVGRESSRKYPNNKKCSIKPITENYLSYLVDILKGFSYLLIMCASAGYAFLSLQKTHLDKILLTDSYIDIVLNLSSISVIIAICFHVADYPQCKYPEECIGDTI